MFSVTAQVNLDNCYRVAKSRGRSLFIYYSYAIIKAMNEIEEFRLRVNRVNGELELCIFDDVDLVAPITVAEEGEFVEVRIGYNVNFEEFYKTAEQVISAASIDMNPITEDLPEATYAVVSALPFLDFTAVTPTLMDRGGVGQVPLISVGKMSEVNGHRSMPIAIAVHHGFVDGYHVGLFFEQVQRTLDSYE
ncbi:MAG: CatA-like O-acetyltransferase [Rikenellaceae bacterium]